MITLRRQEDDPEPRLASIEESGPSLDRPVDAIGVLHFVQRDGSYCPFLCLKSGLECADVGETGRGARTRR